MDSFVGDFYRSFLEIRLKMKDTDYLNVIRSLI